MHDLQFFLVTEAVRSVPTLMEVSTKVFNPRFLANPKSHSLARPLESSRIFCINRNWIIKFMHGPASICKMLSASTDLYIVSL